MHALALCYDYYRTIPLDTKYLYMFRSDPAAEVFAGRSTTGSLKPPEIVLSLGMSSVSVVRDRL